MHNSQCTIDVSPAAMIEIVGVAHTLIMHYAFCIVH